MAFVEVLLGIDTIQLVAKASGGKGPNLSEVDKEKLKAALADVTARSS
jgi:hypothetical protein